jgi:hypothetical protein
VLKEIFAVIYKKLPIFYEDNNILEIVEYSKGEKLLSLQTEIHSNFYKTKNFFFD